MVVVAELIPVEVQAVCADVADADRHIRRQFTLDKQAVLLDVGVLATLQKTSQSCSEKLVIRLLNLTERRQI